MGKAPVEVPESAEVRIVNFCAASSVPSDLGVYLLNKQLGGELSEAKGFFELGGGSFSGGTIASISHALDTGDAAREKDSFLLNPNNLRPKKQIERDPSGLRYDRDAEAWTAPSPLGISNTRAVRRSGVLTGRDIVYQEYAVFSAGYFSALRFNWMVGLFGAAMRVQAIRNFIQKKIPPGTGPDEARMDAGWFNLRIVGTAGAGARAAVTLKGRGDIGNRMTVKCFCACALAMALDEDRLPTTFGVLTPSVAFGDILLARLQSAGIEIATQHV